MQFSCEKVQLLQAVATASRTVASKSAIQSLEGLLIEAGNGLPKVIKQDGYQEAEHT